MNQECINMHGVDVMAYNPMAKIHNNGMLTVMQVAEYCGVSPQTVYLWIENSDLKVVRSTGTNNQLIVKVPLFALNKFIKQHTTKP